MINNEVNDKITLTQFTWIPSWQILRTSYQGGEETPPRLDHPAQAAGKQDAGITTYDTQSVC